MDTNKYMLPPFKLLTGRKRAEFNDQFAVVGLLQMQYLGFNVQHHEIKGKIVFALFIWNRQKKVS